MADGTQTGQTIETDDQYRVQKQTILNGTPTAFTYDANGNLTEETQDSKTTRFEYDPLDRLTAVVTTDCQRLEYHYALGEPSLITQADAMTGHAPSSRRDTGLTFASYSEVFVTRTENSTLGAVRFSSALGRFQVSGADGSDIVESFQDPAQPLMELHLMSHGKPLYLHRAEFQMPSNRFFLPPEYVSSNCCVICKFPPPPGGCGCDGGGGPAPPTISGPNTLWWFKGLAAGVSGYVTQITLTASSNGNGTSYQWAITAGSDKVSLSTSTSATVQVTGIGQSKNANDVSITVTVGGQPSDPFYLTVRAPYTFGTDPAHPKPAYLSDNTYVWQTDVYNIVLDNLLTPLPTTVSVNEQWTTAVVPDYSGTNWRQPAPNSTGCVAITNAELIDGIFGEVSSRIPTPVYNVNQNGTAVQHWGQEWRIGTCTTGAGPRVETNTLQKYTDHAAYTGVTTPAP